MKQKTRNPVAKAVRQIRPKVIPDLRDKVKNIEDKYKNLLLKTHRQELEELLEPFVEEALEWAHYSKHPVMISGQHESPDTARFTSEDLGLIVKYARRNFSDEFLKKHHLTRLNKTCLE
jgi:hypothetical protein